MEPLLEGLFLLNSFTYFFQFYIFASNSDYDHVYFWNSFHLFVFASLLPLSFELFEFKYLFAVDPQNPFSWILSVFVFVFVVVCQLPKDRFRESSLF